MKENKQPSAPAPASAPPPIVTVATETPSQPPKNPAAEANTSFSSQVFSPLRDPASDLSPAASVSSARLRATPNHLLGGPSSPANTTLGSSLFSPLREANQNSFSSTPPNSRPTSALTNKTPLVSPLTIIREETPKKQRDVDDDPATPTTTKTLLNMSNSARRLMRGDQETTEQASEQPSELQQQKRKQQETLPTVNSQLFQKQSGYVASTPSPNAPALASSEVQTRKKAPSAIPAPEPSFASSSSEINALMTAFPQVLLEKAAEEKALRQPAASEGGQEGGPSETVASQLPQFQQNFLRSCVEESMEEFVSEMRKHLWHQQLDAIMASQRQTEELSEVLESHRGQYERLAEENARLRRENEELRRYL